MQRAVKILLNTSENDFYIGNNNVRTPSIKFFEALFYKIVPNIIPSMILVRDIKNMRSIFYHVFLVVL